MKITIIKYGNSYLTAEQFKQTLESETFKEGDFHIFNFDYDESYGFDQENSETKFNYYNQDFDETISTKTFEEKNLQEFY